MILNGGETKEREVLESVAMQHRFSTAAEVRKYIYISSYIHIKLKSAVLHAAR